MTFVVERPTSTPTVPPTGLFCTGCGYRAPPEALPLRCPNAMRGDDIDHVMHRSLDPTRLSWPIGNEPNPFVRYRTLWHAYHQARARALSDAQVVDEIDRLDRAVARVEGHGFETTPFAWHERLGTWIKDETVNVSGSHKARHLFGTLLALRLAGVDDPRRPLAIASCGNAALAAAVVARAAERELHVFVPADADPGVLRRLTALGVVTKICERRAGEWGDPTVARLREAIEAGAVPFTCQGNENGLAIEGGLTIGYELADAMRESGRRLDYLLVQVGGGALASSVIQALGEARALGTIESLPRIYAVQTRNVHPLSLAYEHVRARVDQGDSAGHALDWAARHRSSFMRPWSQTPHSVATGIVDDETYDWLAVVRGMLATGGRPVLVGEEELMDANRLARAATGIDVDTTGSAGLAGHLELRRLGEVGESETCAVLFTGKRRNGGTP